MAFCTYEHIRPERVPYPFKTLLKNKYVEMK